MRKAQIGIVDLVTKAPTRALYARVMNPSLASVMPQAVAVWCEERGHDVRFVCYTGAEDLLSELPDRLDVLFIGAFTQAAQLAYAISNLFRQRGAVTVLGGPHARCYPDDARKYFDYVLGFTDRNVIEQVLDDRAPHRPLGVQLAANRQPGQLPGVRERWKFIAPTLDKCPTRIKVVPMIGSLGCPYTCCFCIDSVVPYQPMSCDQIREDLRFLMRTVPQPYVGWHDPNFGVRFDDSLTAIEEAVPPGAVVFGAESSLSLLSEPNLKRLRAAGFKAMLPGIEAGAAGLVQQYTMNGMRRNVGNRTRSPVRAAGAAQEPGLRGGRRALARDRHWREHGDVRSRADAAADAAAGRESL